MPLSETLCWLLPNDRKKPEFTLQLDNEVDGKKKLKKNLGQKLKTSVYSATKHKGKLPV